MGRWFGVRGLVPNRPWMEEEEEEEEEEWEGKRTLNLPPSPHVQEEKRGPYYLSRTDFFWEDKGRLKVVLHRNLFLCLKQERLPKEVYLAVHFDFAAAKRKRAQMTTLPRKRKKAEQIHKLPPDMNHMGTRSTHREVVCGKQMRFACVFINK